MEVIQLVDIRHKPSEQDKEMYQWILDCGYSGIVIATKLDKIKNSQLQKQINTIRKDLGMADGVPLIPVSADNRKGKYKVWDLFNQIFETNGYDIFLERQNENL